MWYDTVISLLRNLGFRSSLYDYALWVSASAERRHLYITLYVDDFTIFTLEKRDADCLVESLMQRLELKDLQEPKKLLGLEIDRLPSGILNISPPN